jgi:hypothetical protein
LRVRFISGIRIARKITKFVAFRQDGSNQPEN